MVAVRWWKLDLYARIFFASQPAAVRLGCCRAAETDEAFGP
jgi:hypothetical protein